MVQSSPICLHLIAIRVLVERDPDLLPLSYRQAAAQLKAKCATLVRSCSLMPNLHQSQISLVTHFTAPAHDSAIRCPAPQYSY